MENTLQTKDFKIDDYQTFREALVDAIKEPARQGFPPEAADIVLHPADACSIVRFNVPEGADRTEGEDKVIVALGRELRLSRTVPEGVVRVRPVS